jgi:hypothetical protein
VRGNYIESHLQVTRRGGDRVRNVWIEKSTAAATSVYDDLRNRLSITRQIPTKLRAPVITPFPLIIYQYNIFLISVDYYILIDYCFLS